MRSASSNMSLKSFSLLLDERIRESLCPLRKLLRAGNTKVPVTTAIFNMSSAATCPSLHLGLCRAYSPIGKHVCYAKKAEWLYPNALPFRTKQMAYWLSCTAEEFASQFLFVNASKEVPFDALRLNESGDFHTQACIDKADRIACILGNYKIKVYCYTSRSDLDYSKVRHLIISGSSFEKEGISNVFKMVDDIKDKPRGYGVCKGDCKICTRCLVRGKKTVVKRH